LKRKTKEDFRHLQHDISKIVACLIFF